MATIPFRQVRKGMVIAGADGQLHLVVDRDHAQDNGRAALQLRLKNLGTGSLHCRSVHPDDPVDQGRLAKREMQFIYQDGDGYVFMDTESYEQVTLARE